MTHYISRRTDAVSPIIFVLEFFRGITWRVFDSKRVMDRGAYSDVRIVFLFFLKEQHSSNGEQ